MRQDRLEVTHVGIEPKPLRFTDGHSLKRTEQRSPHDNEQGAVKSRGVAYIASHVNSISPERKENGLVCFEQITRSGIQNRTLRFSDEIRRRHDRSVQILDAMLSSPRGHLFRLLRSPRRQLNEQFSSQCFGDVTLLQQRITRDVVVHVHDDNLCCGDGIVYRRRDLCPKRGERLALGLRAIPNTCLVPLFEECPCERGAHPPRTED